MKNRIVVLFVEDDQDDYFLGKRYLENDPRDVFDCIWARNKQEALRQVSERADIDVILVDYNLGGDSGLELIETLREKNGFFPVIMLSGQPQTGIDYDAMYSGFDDFLDKRSLNTDVLSRSIRYAIERKRNERNNEKILREKAGRETAEKLNWAKSVFLANVSHEIRTPLSAVLGFIELLADKSIDSYERDKYIETIRKNGLFLLNIINDLLDLSKIEANRMELENEKIVIRDLFADVAYFFRPKADRKGISFDLELSEHLPESFQTDPTRLRQILFNLISNAIKFTSEGSVRVEVSLRELHAKERVSIAVIDTGSGIEPTQKHRIFEPFMQGDTPHQKKSDGTGLGLALSKKLAQAMGGELVLVWSEPGKGSRFQLEIPLIADVKAETKDRKKPVVTIDRVKETQPLAGRQILIAEDTLDSQILLGTLLRKAGAEVAVASNGKVALEHAQKQEYDVVLMDLQMPMMDGISATKALRAGGYTKPIIALTAYAFKEERDRCLASGFNDHIAKPINFGELFQKIVSNIESGV